MSRATFVAALATSGRREGLGKGPCSVASICPKEGERAAGSLL